MGIFDTLSESRYQKWLEERSTPGYQTSEPVGKTAARKSFEGLLFQDILHKLELAATCDTCAKKDKYLLQAAALETQLLISLEKQGLGSVATILQKSLSEKKQVINPR